MELLDAIVVGGGQAGLGIGYFLKKADHDFVIFERRRIGETWRSQRWDSFAVNTPNWSNGLPGHPYDGDQPDGFYLRDELVDYFEQYAAEFGLPIRRGMTVTAVDRNNGDGTFCVEAVDSSGATEVRRARNVVVASGIMQTPKIPQQVSAQFPAALLQLHAGDYRSAGQLPDGAVVVVGSGQSGCQIAGDLIHTGRIVYVCTSKVARLPRRYRGRDVLEWSQDMGLWDVEVGAFPDPAMQFAAQPQVSGVGRYGATVSLQDMQRQGARLMGRLTGVSDGVMRTDDSLSDHIAFADERSHQFKADIDAYITAQGLDAVGPEDNPIDDDAGPEVAARGLTELDLSAADVTSVIWCTGFSADFGWLHLPVFDDRGHPIHNRGISEIPGVYFLGFPWLHSGKSGVIHGIEEDAGHLFEDMSKGS